MEEPIRRISADRMAEFREAFNLFDVNGEGRIGVGKLGAIFREIGQTPSDEDLKIMLDEADQLNLHQENTITFEEFLTLMQKRMSDIDTETELIEAFRICDEGGKGLIQVDELKKLMIDLGDNLSPTELEAIIKCADFDNDGYINYTEFVKQVLNK